MAQGRTDIYDILSDISIRPQPTVAAAAFSPFIPLATQYCGGMSRRHVPFPTPPRPAAPPRRTARLAVAGLAAGAVAVLLPGLAACSPVGTAVGAGAMVATAAAEERGISGAADDAGIKLTVLRRYAEEEVLFQGIGTTVFDGRVLLTGQVPDADLKARAIALAAGVGGVSEVIDHVAVTPAPENGTGPRDALIQADLRRLIMFDPEILAINYAIEVEDGIVYLLGIAQSRAERDRALAHARGTGYVRGVVDLVRLKTDPRRKRPARTGPAEAPAAMRDGA